MMNANSRLWVYYYFLARRGHNAVPVVAAKWADAFCQWWHRHNLGMNVGYAPRLENYDGNT